MKSYVPQAVMTVADPEDEGVGCSAHGTGADDGRGDSLHPKRDMRLNTSIFKEQINSFKKRLCTIVLIEMRCTPEAEVMRPMIEVITEGAARYSGCMEQIGLNHMLISFGAHVSLPLHAVKGCNFLLDVYYCIPVELRKYLVCLVDSSEFMVGTCGARNQNSRVVFGIRYLLEMTKVLWDIECYIAATASTSSHLLGVQSVPIECVQLQGLQSYTVLCELRPVPLPELEKQVLADCELMRAGFSHMCSGEYKLAIANYSAVHDKADAQVQRLLRICQQRHAAGDRSCYVRPAEDVYNFGCRLDGDATSLKGSQATTEALTGLADSASVTVAAAHGREGSGARRSTLGSTAAAASPAAVEGQNGSFINGEEGTSCALLNMVLDN